MPLYDHDLKKRNFIENRFLETILEIKCKIGISDEKFLDFLGVTKTDFSRITKDPGLLQLKQIEALCASIGLSLVSFFSGQIDYLSLTKQFHGNELALPERYNDPIERLGRLRALKSIYSFLKLYFGSSYANNTLSRLQIHPAFLLQENTTFVSWHMYFDFLRELKKKGLEKSHFHAAGTMNLTLNRRSEFGRLLSVQKSPKDLYRAVHEVLVKHYDNLFIYKLASLKTYSCTIETTYNQNAIDLAHAYTLGGRESCLYKQGVYASFLGHLRENFATISERECLYLGDKRCVYDLSWDDEPRKTTVTRSTAGHLVIH